MTRSLHVLSKVVDTPSGLYGESCIMETLAHNAKVRGLWLVLRHPIPAQNADFPTVEKMPERVRHLPCYKWWRHRQVTVNIA